MRVSDLYGVPVSRVYELVARNSEAYAANASAQAVCLSVALVIIGSFLVFLPLATGFSVLRRGRLPRPMFRVGLVVVGLLTICLCVGFLFGFSLRDPWTLYMEHLVSEAEAGTPVPGISPGAD